VAIQYRSGTAYRSSTPYRASGNTIVQLSAKARIQAVIIYDQLDSYIYDDTRSPYDAGIFSSQTLQMRAAIVSAARTISARARLSKLQTAMLESKAYVFAPQRITAGAWISRQQGWPIPDTGDPGYALWQDTRLDSRARVYQYIAFPVQTLRAKSRVTYAKTIEMQAKARIVAAQTLQVRANILPRFFTTHVPASFSVQQTTQRHLRVVFYTGGKVRNWQFTAKARILQTYGCRVTGHFSVPMAAIFDSVLAIADPVTTTRTQQTLNVRAKVIK